MPHQVTRPVPTQAQPTPPEEKFWIKYSPHHELPISSLASLAWHTFAVVLIVVIAFVVARGEWDDMPIETVAFPGGGGNPGGVGPGPGDGSTAAPLVEAAKDLPNDAVRPSEPLADITGLQITPKDLLKDIDDQEAERDLAKITERGTQSLQKLSKLDRKLRDALMDPAGAGKGGPGSGGGGPGAGKGPGVGDGEGDGKLNARTKRKLRWTITFNTHGGDDYLRQLHALQAILAFRGPDGELKVVKELLRRPVKYESDDLKNLNRIFWIDDKRESVEQLARALGLDFVPDQIVALFTHEFERELLHKELAFRNKREDQILETRFQILMRGGNKYDVIVTDQRYY
jgi:hypothetical protein